MSGKITWVWAACGHAVVAAGEPDSDERREQLSRPCDECVARAHTIVIDDDGDPGATGLWTPDTGGEGG